MIPRLAHEAEAVRWVCYHAINAVLWKGWHDLETITDSDVRHFLTFSRISHFMGSMVIGIFFAVTQHMRTPFRTK